MTALPETFRCLPLACTLTRAACAQRFTRAANGGRAAGSRINDVRLMSSACVGCEVGAAHARGEQPDVTVASLAARLDENRGGREMPQPPKQHTHNGTTKTLKEWVASEANVHHLEFATVKSRVYGGMSIGDALASPMQRGARPAKAPVSSKKVARHAPAPKRLTPSVSEVVREALTSVPIVELLERLGYVVEDAGVVPVGRLILVREG